MANGPSAKEIEAGDPKRRLETAVNAAAQNTTGSLNPMWVAWLMGYPTGYLNSVRWETPSSRKSRKK